MIVLSHRGYWKESEEQNRKVAFQRSFDLGFGTETDLRWNNGRIEILHDLESSSPMTFAEVLSELKGRQLPLALNIKCDGLARKIAETMKEAKHSEYFVFDMSIPDMRYQLASGNPVFTRLSEIETQPVMLEQSAGVWLDAFYSEWYSAHDVTALLAKKKKVCVVSPELHKRDHLKTWKMLKELDSQANNQLMLCTDLPEEALRYFKEGNT